MEDNEINFLSKKINQAQIFMDNVKEHIVEEKQKLYDPPRNQQIYDPTQRIEEYYNFEKKKGNENHFFIQNLLDWENQSIFTIIYYKEKQLQTSYESKSWKRELNEMFHDFECIICLEEHEKYIHCVKCNAMFCEQCLIDCKNICGECKSEIKPEICDYCETKKYNIARVICDHCDCVLLNLCEGCIYDEKQSKEWKEKIFDKHTKKQHK